MNEDKVAQKAIACLQEGKSFSAIRLGDGEGRVLLWPDGITREQLNKHLHFWFGYQNGILNREIAAWRRALLVAASRADAVGFYHGDGRSRYWRAVRDLIQMRDGVIECENSLHRELWESGLLTDINRQVRADRIVLVTCRDVQRDEDTIWIRVPEEAHTSGERNDHPERFGEICTAVHKSAGPGVLFLVGAGLFGKIYCDVARDGGAVALDIGSLFDGWAGILSRSYLTKEPKRYTMVGEANESADCVSAEAEA